MNVMIQFRQLWKLVLLCGLISLTLTACGESGSGSNVTYYTSGMVNTKNKLTYTYGRFEVCARLPKTKGIWPAHWLLPNDGHWPPEIDIMELLGHDSTVVYMTMHYGTSSSDHTQDGSNKIHAPAGYNPDFSADFHTFRVDWQPGTITGYVDGKLVTKNDDGTTIAFPRASQIPAESFYMILNTAVGGDWPGDPDSTTVFPQYHDIDFVKIYKWNGSAFVLDFSDDFDGPALNQNVWTPVDRDEKDNYNNEHQYYRAANVSIVKEGSRSFLRLTSLKVSQRP